MIVFSQTQLVANLDALVAADGPLDTVVVRLFQNNIIPTASISIDDLDEADFDGYAASSAVTWLTPYITIGDTAVVWGDTKEFAASGSTTPNTVYGYYLTTGTSPKVLHGIHRFDEPVNVTSALDAVVVFPSVEMQNPR